MHIVVSQAVDTPRTNAPTPTPEVVEEIVEEQVVEEEVVEDEPQPVDLLHHLRSTNQLLFHQAILCHHRLVLDGLP